MPSERVQPEAARSENEVEIDLSQADKNDVIYQYREAEDLHDESS